MEIVLALDGVDQLQQMDSRLYDGYGYRIENGGERGFTPGRSPLTVGASVGYMTRGVLEG